MKKSAWGSWCQIASIFVVYTVFIIYQFLVLYGVIGNSLGGYFSIGLLVSMPFLIACFIAHSVRFFFRVPKIVVHAIFLFLIVFSLNVLFGYLGGANEDILRTHYSAIWRFAGVFLITLCTIPSNKGVVKVALFTVVALVLFLLAAPVDSVRSSYIEISDSNDLFQLNYQALGMVVIILLVYLLPTESVRELYVGYACALVALLMLGARSELIASLIVIGINELYSPRRICVLVLTFVVGLISVAGLALWLTSVAVDGRVFEALDWYSDESVLERVDITIESFRVIFDNPLFGAYASYEVGRFAHNVLSAWVDFGIFGFIILLVLLFYPIAKILHVPYRERGEGVYRQALSSLIAVSVLVLLAKDYTYSLIPFALAVYCRFEQTKVKVRLLEKRLGYGFEA